MDLPFSCGFESYGTRLLLRANDEAVLNQVIDVARSALLGNFHPVDKDSYPLIFDLPGSRGSYDVIRNGELITSGMTEGPSLRYLNAMIRLSVAEFSPELTFLHAGAVGWRGKGIVLPAMSFHGKSTLVYELVKLGAEYYSDDFAIIDREGLLHAFPRQISLRTRNEFYETYDVDPSTIGAKPGSMPITLGLIFLTKYRPRARWAPEILSRGEGVFEVLPFTLPIRQRPDLTLEVLNFTAAQAVIAKSLRGEAKMAARRLLDFFDKTAF